jgi:DUF3089 family protein
MMRAIGVLLAAGAIAAVAGAAPARADVTWLCKPGIAGNPCEIGQDTTIKENGQPDKVVTPPTGERRIDCFYVYPTVSNQVTPNATKARDPELVSIAKYQAARFSTQCRVFAPIYRQATLLSIELGGADQELAYNDVVEAWRDYLANYNQGRGVVLIGHSQGTFVLRRLLREEIEPDAEQLRHIVSALLLGGNVVVPEGGIVGGDFAKTPLCTRQAEVGCVVAYSTYAEDPPPDSLFGRTGGRATSSHLPGGPGYEVACTDPRVMAGTPGRPLNVLTPSEPFALGVIAAGVLITSGGAPPSAATTWVTAPDRYQGGCATINGAHILRYDPIGSSRRPLPFLDATWGTHLLDMSLGFDPLVSFVAQEERRWADPQIGLARSCLKRGRLRLRVAGPDADFVGGFAFRAGKRMLGSDSRAPFQVTLASQELRRLRGKTLWGAAYLRYGPRALSLSSRLRGCKRST